MVDEMIRLRTLLDQNGISWVDKSERLTYPKELGFDDIFISRTHFEFRNYHWSAINGCGTYGEEEGLIELMSNAVNGGEPIGYLTADEVMNLVKGDTNGH